MTGSCAFSAYLVVEVTKLVQQYELLCAGVEHVQPGGQPALACTQLHENGAVRQLQETSS